MEPDDSVTPRPQKRTTAEISGSIPNVLTAPSGYPGISVDFPRPGRRQTARQEISDSYQAQAAHPDTNGGSHDDGKRISCELRLNANGRSVRFRPAVTNTSGARDL